MVLFKSRVSRIASISREELLVLFENCNSMSSLLMALGYSFKGASRNVLKKRLILDGLDPSILTARAKLKNKEALRILRSSSSVPFDLIFCRDSKYVSIKYAVNKFGIMPYICGILSCGNLGSHNGKRLVLQLDHINGVNTDHRVLNLRWLCPNCHSQTSTFGGHRCKLVLKCVLCGNPAKKGSKFGRCKTCSGISLHRITWPTVESMREMIFCEPTSKIAVRLGVSDVAVAKFCKKHNIAKPPRGYWGRGHISDEIR